MVKCSLFKLKVFSPCSEVFLSRFRLVRDLFSRTDEAAAADGDYLRIFEVFFVDVENEEIVDLLASNDDEDQGESRVYSNYIK